MRWEEGEEDRIALLELRQVAGFVVGRAVLPAAPEDAQPFEGEAAQDGGMAFARLFCWCVVGLGPGAVLRR